MEALLALIGVLLVAVVAWLGAQVAILRPLLAIGLPYAGFVVFLAGLSYRVVRWSASPVPFRIPTTSGQQRSLPWLKAGRLESPATLAGVLGRLALEILLFRSLFRNTRADMRTGPRLVYAEDKFLWLGALTFHWSLLVVVIRHLRFLLEPVPGAVTTLAGIDGFFQVTTPALYATDFILVVALTYLLARRVRDPLLRYISLPADYLVLFLVLGIAGSGIWMRYIGRVDMVAIKQMALSLVTFTPSVPAGISPLFFVHLTLVAALAAVFPFSKLVHMAGGLLSPTRNLANTSRAARHVNPWNAPVAVHTYRDWEDEFRDKIRAAGLPLERR
ncbi:MAG: sulfate reduction electron transfer complex DsrMKJOP subunit DsrM [Planctomycetes bacterium]|nr:sulfate reduction electron transfer complex DsrMKJOP subunit DsrM [Planctomycetota bacterium]